MKILMDADCLIKLTKAGIKEKICPHFTIILPDPVKKETVDAGKIKGCPDAELIEKNIQEGLIKLVTSRSPHLIKGDRSLIETYKKGGYDAIATDDTRFIRHLRSMEIPFILPGLLPYFLVQKGVIDRPEALQWIEKLSSFISDDEYSTVKILMEART